jgi:hypothetical protein
MGVGAKWAEESRCDVKMLKTVRSHAYADVYLSFTRLFVVLQ